MTGRIKNINHERGFGFLVGEDGVDRFFHRSLCKENFSAILPGSFVEFCPEDHPRGPRAVDLILSATGGENGQEV